MSEQFKEGDSWANGGEIMWKPLQEKARIMARHCAQNKCRMPEQRGIASEAKKTGSGKIPHEQRVLDIPVHAIQQHLGIIPVVNAEEKST